MNHFEYDGADVFTLAATYAHALTSNHPFVDGNKRTAFAAAGVFLELNGFRLTATEPDAVPTVLALSKGEMRVEDFQEWLRISTEQDG